MTECSVMVGVRIRPFNDREKNLNAKLCVAMEGPKTILQPVEVEEEEKTFAFDASFWSHDGFEDDDEGYSKALPGSNYADQKQVFDHFGKTVLDNAWAGYHCCLFAYGQTGAGKSYSMVGYGQNKGIVPMACEEIFGRIESNTDPTITYEVTVSMVEIYNEMVQDLLVAPKQRPKGGLNIRESKQLGVFVDGAKKRPVNSFDAINKVTKEGTANRTVGSTLMNATSSRAHTVLVIEFVQNTNQSGAATKKVSMINLVDLAGSEKAGQTGASGDRLKEGCAINKSLSALGNVIEKLADQASGKGKPGAIIPYRDSKLTRLLQNALGGSSKTIMICAISPASSNHEETLSTLRYADRAKKIKNAAVINESPQEKLIRELREENEKLKQLVSGEIPATNGDGDNAEDLAQKQADIAALEKALADMQKSFEERLADAAKEEEEEIAMGEKLEKANKTLPHIANLNEDQQLTNRLQFAFPEGSTRIGKDPASVPLHQRIDYVPEIILTGPGMHQEQAVVVNSGGTCTLKSEGVAATTTMVNGKDFADTKEVQLVHGDRIVISSNYFVFVDPSVGKAKELISSGKVSYAMALKEAGGKSGGRSEEELESSRKRAEELEKKAKEAEAAKVRAEQEAKDLVAKREEEYQAKMEALKKQGEEQLESWKQREEEEDKEQAEAHKAELERLQKERDAEIERMRSEHEEAKRKAEEEAQLRNQELTAKARKAATEEIRNLKKMLAMERLDDQLEDAMPLVKEANLIAEELSRPQRFAVKMTVGLDDNVLVTAAVSQDGVELYEWSRETLENRVFLMRELLQRFDDEGPGVLEGLASEDDPFWDPVTVERQIGVAQVLLEPLLNQIENATDVTIMSGEGKPAGTLKVEVWPVGRNGEPGIPDDDLVDDVLGTHMVVLVKVTGATGLPEDLANDVRVEYDYFSETAPQQVPPAPGHSCSPEFGYERKFTHDPVTPELKEWLASSLVFRVFGHNAAAAEVSKNTAGPGMVVQPPSQPKGRNSAPRRCHSNSNVSRTASEASAGNSASHIKNVQRRRDARELVCDELQRLWGQAGLPKADLGDSGAVLDWCLDALTQQNGARERPLSDGEVPALVLRTLLLAAQSHMGCRECGPEAGA